MKSWTDKTSKHTTVEITEDGDLMRIEVGNGVEHGRARLNPEQVRDLAATLLAWTES